jgi:hypothetical protein
VSSNQDEWVAKARVFEHSYNEVLLALKHQDEKLNRTLTALTFLTAAAVALFVNYVLKDLPPVRFPHEPTIPVTTFFFVLFLGAALFALLFALAAIGPSDTLPRLHPKKRGARQWPSLLFYVDIEGNGEWDVYAKRPAAWLQECLARNFHEEAKTLAQRVRYKVARSRESAACLQLAILALTLLGVFSARPLSLGTRWWAAAGLMIGVMVQPIWDGVLMGEYHFKEKRPFSERGWSFTWVALALAGATTTVVTAPSTHGHWWAIGAALGTIVATRFSLAHGAIVVRLRKGGKARCLAWLMLPATALAGVAMPLLAWLA